MSDYPLSDYTLQAERSLGQLGLNDTLSLYLHIPFCRSKCHYCGFYSRRCPSGDTLGRYIQVLCAQIEAVNRLWERPFSTVYIGGGNPGLIDGDALYRLSRLCCANGRPVEFSMECNPEDMDTHIGPSLEFINRLSVGVQSLNPAALEFLGRNATLRDTVRGMETAAEYRERYGTALNFDLITCVPGFENASDSDIRSVCADFNPDHLSLYSLTLEEGTVLGSRLEAGLLAPLEDDVQADILLRQWKLLGELGYAHYEVSNFAHEGSMCMHNLRYWHIEPWIGLGAGASSTLDEPYRRIECAPDFRDFCGLRPFRTYTTQTLDRKQQLEEWVMMGLRTADGLSSEECRRRFGFRLPDDLAFRGYRMLNGFFRPDEEGLLLADAAAVYTVGRLEALL